MSEGLDASEILQMLPHRHPFLMVDRVLAYSPMDSITAIKNVTLNEPYFPGHFPGNPVMPGVMILESLAQAGALLSNLSRTPSEGHEFIYFFAGIDNARFKQVVVPGDTLRLVVKHVNRKRDFWIMRGEAFVEDGLVCSADLMSASKEKEK